MPVLSNARHERFCQNLALGKSATEAYELAGYKAADRNAQSASSRLSSNVMIRDRIREIQGNAAARVEITRAKVLAELAKIGFANMADYMTANGRGDVVLDIAGLTRDQSAAIASVTIEEFKDGRSDQREVRRIKFTLADKRAALVDIAKMEGWVIERHEHGAPGEFDSMADAELESALRQEVAALGFEAAEGTQH